MFPSNGSKLVDRICELHAERKAHLEAIASIDRVLMRVSSALAGAGTLAKVESAHRSEIPAPEGEDATAMRRRGRFLQTAESSVLHFVSERGNPSTAELNEHWRLEGRKGTVNVTLFKLLRSGAIRRIHDDAVRGSRYRIAAATHTTSTEAPEPLALANG